MDTKQTSIIMDFANAFDKVPHERLVRKLDYHGIRGPIHYKLNKKKVKEIPENHTNTKANNYSIFIYLFRYMSSIKKHVYLKLLAPMPLL